VNSETSRETEVGEKVSSEAAVSSDHPGACIGRSSASVARISTSVAANSA